MKPLPPESKLNFLPHTTSSAYFFHFTSLAAFACSECYTIFLILNISSEVTACYLAVFHTTLKKKTQKLSSGFLSYEEKITLKTDRKALANSNYILFSIPNQSLVFLQFLFVLKKILSLHGISISASLICERRSRSTGASSEATLKTSVSPRLCGIL